MPKRLQINYLNNKLSYISVYNRIACNYFREESQRKRKKNPILSKEEITSNTFHYFSKYFV